MRMTVTATTTAPVHPTHKHALQQLRLEILRREIEFKATEVKRLRVKTNEVASEIAQLEADAGDFEMSSADVKVRLTHRGRLPLLRAS